MPKLILTAEAQGNVACEIAERSIAAPASFENASPIRQGSTSRDPVRLAVLGIAAIAGLTFLGSMIAILGMHAP